MEQMRSPWEERFTWFWFCKDEILDYTQEDFDRRARELHDRGVTVAINFTMTHFRIGFYPYWDVIHEAMRKFAVACHKYGIRVVEHHSTSLIHDLLSSSGWERFEEDLVFYRSEESGKCFIEYIPAENVNFLLIREILSIKQEQI